VKILMIYPKTLAQTKNELSVHVRALFHAEAVPPSQRSRTDHFWCLQLSGYRRIFVPTTAM